MSSKFESDTETAENYGLEYKPDKTVKVIKKDGSLEAFNVQKVIDAVPCADEIHGGGKAAYLPDRR